MLSSVYRKKLPGGGGCIPHILPPGYTTAGVQEIGLTPSNPGSRRLAYHEVFNIVGQPK